MWQNRIVERATVKASQLLNMAGNWRIHPEAQRAGMVGVLNEVGIIDALTVYEAEDGLTVIDGHLRKSIDPEQEWPVDILDVSPEEADYILATKDPLAAAASADREKLGALLQNVKSGEAGVQSLLSELAEREGVMFGGNGKPPEDPGPQVDKAEALQVKWGVTSGDIWQAGDHYVICGDCRETETWERLLQAAGVEMVNGVFTSPPYAEQRKQQYGGVPVGEYVDWWEAVQVNVRTNLAGDGSFFVNIKPHCEDGQRVLYVFDLVLAMVRWWGWRFVDELCWTRNPFPGGYDNRFKNGFEPVYHFGLSKVITFNKSNVAEQRIPNTHVFGKSGSLSGFESVVKDTGTGVLPTNVINAETGEVNIGTQSQSATFPIALPDFFIRAYSDPGDVWCDPFLGSGTTICASHQNQRRGLGIEKLEKYVSVTLERLAGMGLEPRRVE